MKKGHREAWCDGKPPGQFLKAVEEFNAGMYYRCHDTLEDIWRDEPGEIRKLYQGILQVAVALYHERNGNLKGAVRLMESGMALAEPFGPRCLGLALGEFLAACRQATDFLRSPAVGRLPRELHPRLNRCAGEA